MALHPHKSRRRRMETAGTAAALYLTVTALFGAAMYVQGAWADIDSMPIVEFVVFGAVGLVALVAYVRGGER